MAVYAQVAAMDVLLRDRAQVFILGVLVLSICFGLPANPVIKMTDFLLDIRFSHVFCSK